ncbi:MAG: cell division protein CrgA [Actinomycetota bacterium]|nr:cell division protein CrgA [Actinomycetota bacterium]
MARHDKSKSRVTPKGTTSTPPAGPEGAAIARAKQQQQFRGPSPRWVPAMMLVFFAVGVLAILLNYLEVLPGAASNWYLLGGLASVLAGIITATQYR